jgi:phospholipid/cholesterol/gamma-HCH transport system ATP-binding protein
MTGTPVISIRNLRTQFGRTVIHDGVDLDVLAGEVMGIVGASGAGKSVLMRAIVGLMTPTAGTIRLFGADRAAMPQAERSALERRYGVLFQNGALFSSLTVAQNVMVPLKEHTDMSPALMAEIVAYKIALSGLSHDACAKYPSELSGGMRKRAGLARALTLDPEILFLDEPTAGLDPIGAAAFDDLIGDLQSTLGLTVVMVTHDLDSLYAICDRVAVLVDKHAIIGTIETLAENQHPWIHDYFHGPRSRAATASGVT